MYYECQYILNIVLYNLDINLIINHYFFLSYSNYIKINYINIKLKLFQ
jgi:hypothetical protein